MKWLRGKKQGPQPAELRDGAWQISEASYEGRPLIAWFNTDAKRFAGRSDYPIRIGIVVPYITQMTAGCLGSLSSMSSTTSRTLFALVPGTGRCS